MYDARLNGSDVPSCAISVLEVTACGVWKGGEPYLCGNGSNLCDSYAVVLAKYWYILKATRLLFSCPFI